MVRVASGHRVAQHVDGVAGDRDGVVVVEGPEATLAANVVGLRLLSQCACSGLGVAGISAFLLGLIHVWRFDDGGRRLLGLQCAQIGLLLDLNLGDGAWRPRQRCVGWYGRTQTLCFLVLGLEGVILVVHLVDFKDLIRLGLGVVQHLQVLSRGLVELRGQHEASEGHLFLPCCR